jgi:hypothetical protein
VEYVTEWDGPVLADPDDWFHDVQEYLESPKYEDREPQGCDVEVVCGEKSVITLDCKERRINEFVEGMLEAIGEKYCNWTDKDVADYIPDAAVETLKVKMSELIDDLLKSSTWFEYSETNKRLVINDKFVEDFYVTSEIEPQEDDDIYPPIGEFVFKDPDLYPKIGEGAFENV